MMILRMFSTFFLHPALIIEQNIGFKCVLKCRKALCYGLPVSISLQARWTGIFVNPGYSPKGGDRMTLMEVIQLLMLIVAVIGLTVSVTRKKK